jgi:NADH dehydrogenase
VLALAIGLADLGRGPPAAGADVSFGDMIGAGANWLPIALALPGPRGLAFAIVPRVTTGISYGLVLVAFVWELFGSLLVLPGWTVELSPFHQVASSPRVVQGGCSRRDGCDRVTCDAYIRVTLRTPRPDRLMSENGRHRVVVIGGGFGGLQAVAKLARAPVDITLIDRRNFHLFQPLTYQIATGALSPEEVCYPLRAIFKRRRNVRVLLGEVTEADLEAHTLRVEHRAGEGDPVTVPYDTLIAAGGSRYSYFGHDEWKDVAREVKSLESAIAVRGRILSAFEEAELEPEEEKRRGLLTFVVVGAGPTGVEMAGQIGELARDTLRRDFREIDPRAGRVLLIELADRVLTSFPPSLSAKAARSLENLGVTPMLRKTVVEIDEESVMIESPDGGRERIPTRTVIWAAGVTAASLARRLAEGADAELDRAGRVTVEPDLTLPGHPEVFALGDMVRVKGEGGEIQQLLGVAPVAMQQGRYAAKVVKARLQRREYKPFHYRDKGNLATIGRARAVADLHVVRLSGFPAWIAWLVVHLWYLIGFQNRLLVMIRWAISFFTHGRGGRLIEEFEEPAKAPVQAGGPR